MRMRVYRALKGECPLIENFRSFEVLVNTAAYVFVWILIYTTSAYIVE